MNKRGYAAVGLYMPRNPINVGSALRAAYCYNASMVASCGERYLRHGKGVSSDTCQSHRHIPFFETPDLFSVVPEGCKTVAVDLVPGAWGLPFFAHPQRAFYIFGPEDGTLPPEIVNKCDYSLMVPELKHCMNLAATINVVLYDRLAKHMTRRGWQEKDILLN